MVSEAPQACALVKAAPLAAEAQCRADRDLVTVRWQR